MVEPNIAVGQHGGRESIGGEIEGGDVGPILAESAWYGAFCHRGRDDAMKRSEELRRLGSCRWCGRAGQRERVEHGRFGALGDEQDFVGSGINGDAFAVARPVGVRERNGVRRGEGEAGPGGGRREIGFGQEVEGGVATDGAVVSHVANQYPWGAVPIEGSDVFPVFGLRVCDDHFGNGFTA